MTNRTRFINRCLLFVLCTSLLVWAITFVDPTTVFEVGDGNSVPGNSAANCDWDTLNNGLSADTNTPAGVCGGASASLTAYGFFVGSTNEKAFTGGGSK